jgi:hypothetical protein
LAFNPSTLVTDLGTSGFKNKLNSNFAKIQTDLNAISNELPKVAPREKAGSVAILGHLSEPDGVVGTESFGLTFSATAVTVTHGFDDGTSAAIMADRYYKTTQAFSKTFASIVSAPGDYTVWFGVRALAAPLLEMLFELESTETEQDLTIWSFDLNLTGVTYTVTNLRRVATVLSSREAFTRVFTFEHPLTWHHAGLLPAGGGPFDTGIIVPWDCEVTGGYARLGTAPVQWTNADSVEVIVRTGGGTDADDLFTANAVWAPGDDGLVRTFSPLAEPMQLAAGTFVYPEVMVDEFVNTEVERQAADLSLTLLLRQIYQGVY